MQSGNRIFISYAREDQEFAERIYAFLRLTGFRPWMDVHDLIAGEQWAVAIHNALEDAAFVVICLSPRSVDKRGFLQKEIRTALEHRDNYLESDVYLIPALLEDCPIPRALRDFQYVDCRRKDWASKLAGAIRAGFERRA
ncbi:MAG: toll/interleukin-1 receptor domain-containing protein [bacterium]|nr:toll/interleukin-1 receptor domain-containing protein [bacterium]